VGIVFNTLPRIAGSSGTIWIDRAKEQEKFDFYVATQGDHVVVDGPTGTGKTSLAFTGLQAQKREFARVVVTEGMQWSRLCAEAMGPATATGSTTVHSFGIDTGLPTLVFKRHEATPGDPPPHVKHVPDWAQKIDEHSLARAMIAAKVSLMIDDVEAADEALILRMANLAKLLSSDPSCPVAAKVVFVGTGDVFRRLYLAKPQLEGRMRQVSLGTLPERGRSWDFLRQGFERLGRRHAGVIADDKRHMKRVVETVFAAADGLPKALNELGKEIARPAKDHDIRASDVIDAAVKKAQDNWRRYRREAKRVIEGLRAFPGARAVASHMHEVGIGIIHHADDVHSALAAKWTAEQVDFGIEQLVALRFATRTGRDREVLFVQEPALAHTLGVVLQNPAEYRGADELASANRDQMDLLF
jgi:hypothetical protein